MADWRLSQATILLSLVLSLCLGALFQLPMKAVYTDLIAERGYFADEHGHETLNSVQAKTFTPFEGPLFLGNNLRPVWLKLTLAPSANPDWVLMLQPNFVHWAEVWTPQPAGGWQRQTLGSKLAFSSRSVQTLVPAVRIQPFANERMTLYVRVKTPTTPVFVRVISASESAVFDSVLSLVSGAFLGVGFIVMLFSLLVYHHTRDRLWGLDALYNLCGIAILSLQLGIAQRLVFPDAANLANQVMLYGLLLHVFITVILHRAIFRLFTLRPWLYGMNTLMLLAFPALVLLAWWGKADIALQLNNLLIFLSACWGILLVIYARHSDRLLLTVFRISYFGLLAYFVWWGIAQVLQAQTGNLSTLYPSLPLSIFSMLMLTLMLLRNTQIKADDAKRIAEEKLAAEQALRDARLRHEETNNFLGMLLHEVKNPLSTIRLSVSNLEQQLAQADASVLARLVRINDSVNGIDDVLERGVEIDSLEQGALSVCPSLVNVSALVADFVHAHAAAARLQLRAPEVIMARVDTDLVQMMLRNLIDNAVKYARENTTIDIVLTQSATQWQVSVRNMVGAIGFPEPDKLFNKYYRSPLAMRRSGLGLGLYWVRGVARHMGGDALYAQDEHWVEFTLWLPN